MQNPSSFTLMKRALFPYSGEDPLSLKQGLRVVLAWILVFTPPLLLLVLLLTLIEGFDMQSMVNGLLVAFLLSAGIFGFFSTFVVVMSNRAARLRQAWKARNGQS
jgi:hypothetical protein